MRPAVWMGLLLLLCGVSVGQTTDDKDFFDRTDLDGKFRALDADDDGLVSIAEFRLAVKGAFEDDISEFFSLHDANLDGVLTYAEYTSRV